MLRVLRFSDRNAFGDSQVAEQFQSAIESQAADGYTLETWQLSTCIDPYSQVVSTVVAIFVKRPRGPWVEPLQST